MPGPLPKPDARRRNQPTIPTTALPASGRQGEPPQPPYDLGAAGAAWWLWAWSTPQSCAWNTGDLYVTGRRAVLEDLVAAGGPLKEVSPLIREMRELDDRLGLTPKGLAQLRWKIVDEQAEAAEQAKARDELAARRRVKAVDPTLAAER